MKQFCKYLFLFLFLNVLFGVSVLDAQRSDNPFDIQPAPGTTENHAEQVPLTGNPFDLRIPPKEWKTPVVPIPGSRPMEEIALEVQKSGRFRFVLVLSILILLTFSVSLFRSIIQKTYRSFLNDNFMNQVHREQAGLTSWPYLVLYGVFLFHLGTFVYLAGLEKNLFPDNAYGSHLWRVIGVVSGLIFTKHLVLTLMGGLYPLQKETGQYSFSLIIFGIMCGLILIPFNLLLAYGPENLRPGMIYAVLAILLLLYLYRSVRGVLIGARLLSMHQFHFLLYICTVEIAPIIWLVKIFEPQAS
ncbi:MAG: DUF4271 domain-containing protein [Saprospiraceae bacterium]|nr:DUF4271 domain-containing protein [Saprospiraceae bacterium]